MIPPILHQTWKNRDLTPLFTECQERWLRLHPDYEYCFYNDNEIREVVKKYTPQYLKFFDSMNHQIERVDFFRYVILWARGGIYVDMDTCPLKSFDDFLSSDEVILGKEPSENIAAISNAIMCSPQGHPFWINLIDFIIKNYKTGDRWNSLFNTGPGVLDKFDDYEGVKILPSCTFCPIPSDSLVILPIQLEKLQLSHDVSDLEQTYAVHLWASTWWPSNNFILPFFLILIALLVIMFVWLLSL